MIDWLRTDTILHALDNRRIQKEIENYPTLSKTDKGLRIYHSIFRRALHNAITGSILLRAASLFFDTKNATIFPTKEFLLENASHIFFKGILFEEIVFRLGVQTATKYFTPWSPSKRILFSNLCFALWHLRNIGKFSTAVTVTQIAQVILFPTQAILYETHGGFVSSFISHVGNNVFMALPILLRG